MFFVFCFWLDHSGSLKVERGFLYNCIPRTLSRGLVIICGRKERWEKGERKGEKEKMVRKEGISFPLSISSLLYTLEMYFISWDNIYSFIYSNLCIKCFLISLLFLKMLFFLHDRNKAPFTSGKFFSSTSWEAPVPSLISSCEYFEWMGGMYVPTHVCACMSVGCMDMCMWVCVYLSSSQNFPFILSVFSPKIVFISPSPNTSTSKLKIFLFRFRLFWILLFLHF